VCVLCVACRQLRQPISAPVRVWARCARRVWHRVPGQGRHAAVLHQQVRRWGFCLLRGRGRLGWCFCILATGSSFVALAGFWSHSFRRQTQRFLELLQMSLIDLKNMLAADKPKVCVCPWMTCVPRDRGVFAGLCFYVVYDVQAVACVPEGTAQWSACYSLFVHACCLMCCCMCGICDVLCVCVCVCVLCV
jgi:hypothetical protein